MTKKKKIVYIIFTHKTGLGGHFYSLKALSNSLRFDNDVSVINIGSSFSKVFKNQLFKTYYIKHRNIVNSCLVLKRLIEKIKPDILHTFDPSSLTFLEIIMRKQKIKHIHTHCGGPNPKYFLYVRSLILFSQENYLYFRTKKKHNDSNLFLIPNRVYPIRADSKRICALLYELEFKFPIFLRITRISRFYLLSIIQSINLIKNIRKRGIKANLIIIGTPLEQDIFEYIKKYENSYIKIITQEKYTTNASELIKIADFVIGTGRSFMEGAYFSKVMLVPQMDETRPLLIDKETFDIAFDVNFSERTSYKNYDQKKNMDKIIKCISNENSYNELAGFIKKKSENYFEMSSKTVLYNEIYNNLVMDYINQNNLDLLIAILKFIKKRLSSYIPKLIVKSILNLKNKLTNKQNNINFFLKIVRKIFFN